MIQVTKIRPRELRQEYGLDLGVCQTFLAEAQRHMPQASLSRFVDGMVITHPRPGRDPVIAYRLDIMTAGYVTISSGTDPSHRWSLAPRKCIKNMGAFRRHIRVLSIELEIVTGLDILERRLHELMLPFYQEHGIRPA